MLEYYLHHQKDVITHRTKSELKKAEARVYILAGLRITLDHIDGIIRTIRGSQNSDIAEVQLIQNFGLGDRQSQAILDVRLVCLTGLERDKIEAEYRDLQAKIVDYKDILAKPERIDEIIYNGLSDIQKHFGDDRRTKIAEGEAVSIEDEDLIEQKDVLLTFTYNGYTKRMSADEFKVQNRGGRGIKGMGVQDDDFINHLIFSSIHDFLLFFTNLGEVYSKKAYKTLEFGRDTEGLPIVNLLEFDKSEKIQAVINVPKDASGNHLFFVTKMGTVKETKVSKFQNIRRNDLIALTLRDGDELNNVLTTNGKQNILIGTHSGYAVTFNEDDVRSTGGTAAGVRGINLRDNDYVAGSDILEPSSEVLVISEKGYGKRTAAPEYPIKGRSGKGIKTANITEKNGPLAGVTVVSGDEDIILTTSAGVMIHFDVDGVSQTGQATLGIRLIKVDDSAQVAGITAVPKANDEDERSTDEEEPVEED